MANSEFAEYICDQLAELGEVSSARFFGGVGFKLVDCQFAMCMGNTLYLVVDDVLRQKYLAMGSKPFSYKTKKGQRLVHRYYEVPDEILENQQDLLDWARESISVAVKAPRKRT